MVAPQQDFPVRRRIRNIRTLLALSEPPQSADELLRDRRSSLAFRALAAMLFGFAFLWPALPEAMVIRLFAGYALVDGVLTLASGEWGSPYRLGWPLLIGGCIDICGAGAVYLSLSSGAGLGLLTNIAMLWAIANGVAFTLASATLRASDTEHIFFAGAIASLVFGRALLSQLATDPIVLSTWMGLHALTMAVLFLKLTLKHYRVTWL